MNKKVLGMMIGGIVLCVVGVVGFFIFHNKELEERQDNMKKSSSNDILDEAKIDTKKANGKVLVVYYSATNHTKNVAEKIADYLDASLFEIVPKEQYTSDDLDWTDDNSRVSREHKDESLRNIELTTTEISDWSQYDIVFIGYPIWWGVAAWPVNSFVKANDFTGKTVIPFCTSSSSGLGESGDLLKAEAKGGNWIEGHRFSSSPTDSDIQKFIDSIHR